MGKVFHPPALPALLPVLLCLSCAFLESNTAILWTDRSELILYAEFFNAAQSRYKIECRYYEDLAQKLTSGEENVDIAAGSWLKSASTRSLFRPLDSLFKDGSFASASFYAPLLGLGNIENKQYLLPVCFNIPLLVFARGQGNALSNPFTISLEEAQALGKAYNIVEKNGSYSRMGFSPGSDANFLFAAATLLGASFREASPLDWDADRLEGAVDYLRRWIRDANTGVQAEDDFLFKNFDPPEKLISSGRIFFTYMESSAFFTLTQEQRDGLDFRSLAENGRVSLPEGGAYYGICKNGKAKRAAMAFTKWFFQIENQRLFLEFGRNNRMNEVSFGICNGFSALKAVTEEIFPQFYPNLLGRMPPEEYLSPPDILPRNWETLKNRIIIPYLTESIRVEEENQGLSLEKRLAAWYRINH